MSNYKNIDEYISKQSPEISKRLTEIRELFHDVLPENEEKISYDIPAFSVGSDHLYMSAYQHHIGFYPMYGIPELDGEMDAYRGKGTKDALHCNHDQPIPMELIKKIIIAKSKN